MNDRTPGKVFNEKDFGKGNRIITFERESGHKPDWKEVEIIAKENKIVKGKFKGKVLHLPGKTKTIF